MKITHDWNNFIPPNQETETTENESYMVITSGFDLNRFGFLSNFLEILSDITTENIEVVTTISPNPQKSKYNSKIIFSTIHPKQSYSKYSVLSINPFFRVTNYIKTQLSITSHILRTNEYDTYIFFLAQSLTIPIIVLRLLGKKVILVLGASNSNMGQSKNDRLLMFMGWIDRINFIFANKLIIYSQNLIEEWNLEKFRQKILIAHEHFLDFNTFTTSTQLSNRPHLVGYIGRLSGEKGIQHFVQALPPILNYRQDICIFIGGDGPLKEEIETSLQEKKVADRANLAGWISHEDLPKYLNQLHLLVLPSYTEGLPNIMLEAMACGTPVLATPVGAIPDVIIDGKTGFIMKNNSPECIAESIRRVMDSQEIEHIAEDGRRFVEDNFAFDKTLENWKLVLQGI